MSGKYLKKKSKKKRKQAPLGLLVVIALALLACVIAMVVLLTQTSPAQPQENLPEQPQQTEQEHTAAETPANPEAAGQRAESSRIDLGEGLIITRIGNYTGLFMEDGTDEVVSGILMVELENTSDKDLQLAFIRLHYGEEEAVFQVTNLPAGKKLVALENSRMAYRPNAPDSAVAEHTAFVDEFSMHGDEIEIVALDGVLNVINVSDRDLDSNIYVYYKNVAAGVYYGGITYRVPVEGGLKAGEIRQVMSQHYHVEGSEIVMVSYGQ